MTGKSNSPHNHRPRLTYTETLYYYNQSGRSFEVPCPAHDNLHLPLRISRDDGDSLRVDCDNGCTREAILEALIALIRGGSVPPAGSFAAKPEPREQPSHTKANSSTRDSGGKSDPPAAKPPARSAKSIRPKKVDNLPGKPLTFKVPKPVPYPVDGAQLLTAVANLFAEFVYLPKGAAETVAAWCVGTYMHADPRLEVSTFLRFTSASKQCGKTTLLGAVKELVLRPLSAGCIKEAQLFRTVEECAPTMIMDEIDQNQNLRPGSDLTGLINGSQKRSEAQTIRMVPTGRHMVSRSFSTWCPKLLVGIRQLPDTVADRCVSIRLSRQIGPKLPKWRTRDKDHVERLGSEIVRWAADNADAVMQARDALSLPEWLSDRAQDAWEILFAIAHVAGGDWPARMSHACQRIQVAANALEEHDWIEILATDLLPLLEGCDRHVFSKTLVENLRAIEDGPWNEYRPKGLTQYSLALMLKQLGIPRARTVRVGSATAKGYEVAELLKVCKPYAFDQGDDDTTMLRHACGEPANTPEPDETVTRDGAPDAPVTPDVTLSASNGADCDGVTNEITVICKTEGDECQHELKSWRGAPDNGEFIPWCKDCRAWNTPAGWLFWDLNLRWHLRCDSRWMKWRYKDSTESVERGPVEGKVSIPMCPECRGTVQVHGQCLFCTYPGGLTFPPAA